ncbi:MAG TPA: hypothetical protein VEQ85_07835 [Lacipirellulaceae bacterium]|nr:hypothetical protein [Lacipirellulaceae bacterium]
MSITRVGSTEKFASGWETIFAGKQAAAQQGKKSAKSPAGQGGKKSKKKPKKDKRAAKAVAPAAPGLPKKPKKRPKAVSPTGPGDEVAKRSAAKRKGTTRTKRPRPSLR